MASLEDKKYFAQMFRAMDKNGDGVITSDEFKQLISESFLGDKNKKMKINKG